MVDEAGVPLPPRMSQMSLPFKGASFAPHGWICPGIRCGSPNACCIHHRLRRLLRNAMPHVVARRRGGLRPELRLRRSLLPLLPLLPRRPLAAARAAWLRLLLRGLGVHAAMSARSGMSENFALKSNQALMSRPTPCCCRIGAIGISTVFARAGSLPRLAAAASSVAMSRGRLRCRGLRTCPASAAAASPAAAPTRSSSPEPGRCST